jgi:hypothetical protein
VLASLLLLVDPFCLLSAHDVMMLLLSCSISVDSFDLLSIPVSLALLCAYVSYELLMIMLLSSEFFSTNSSPLICGLLLLWDVQMLDLCSFL